MYNDEKRKPFILKPAAKDYLWGGNRLNDDFSKNIKLNPVAETWECSTHPDGESIVMSGEFFGKSLREVLKNNKSFVGKHSAELMKNNGLPEYDLPILVKLIDAKKNLSIQVHPSDEYAKKFENGQLGKTEVWYVIDALSDSKLVYGLKQTVSPKDIKKAIENGTLEDKLNVVNVKKNDIFYIEAGTIHAIGAGVLIAEIQENSNLTYRLYDYNRKDKYGNLRDLHVEKALSVAKLQATNKPEQPMRVLNYRPGVANELLYRCKYFQLERMLLNTERVRNLARISSDDLSFYVLLCINGCGMFEFEKDMIPFFKGDCLFIPANSVEIKMHGRAEFLKIHC